jgi:hypothetical protein
MAEWMNRFFHAIYPFKKKKKKKETVCINKVYPPTGERELRKNLHTCQSRKVFDTQNQH